MTRIEAEAEEQPFKKKPQKISGHPSKKPNKDGTRVPDIERKDYTAIEGADRFISKWRARQDSNLCPQIRDLAP